MARRIREALIGASLLAALAQALPRALAGEPEVKKTARGLTYSVRVPDGWSKEKGGLLVVMFYPKGEHKERVLAWLQGVAGIESAVVAVPEAPNPDRAWRTSDDLPIVGDLLDTLRNEHRPSRTVVFGFSHGGFMALMCGVRFHDKVDAVIAHSSAGISPYPVPSPAGTALRKEAFILIHGNDDKIVPISYARKCLATLEAAGLPRVRLHEVEGLEHAASPPDVGRAFEWIEKVLPPPVKPLPDDQAEERISELSRALKAKDGESAAKAFADLAGAKASFETRIVALARAGVVSDDRRVALAAIDAASRLGEPGVGALELVSPSNEALAPSAAQAMVRTGPRAPIVLLPYLKGKSAKIAVGAARALGDLGTRGSFDALVHGLEAAEEAKVPDDRLAAIKAALEKITLRSLATAKEYREWDAERKH